MSFIKGEIGKQFGIEDLGPLIHSGHTIRTRLPHERDLDLSGDTTHILQLKTSRDVNISSALCYSRNLILGWTSPSQSHSFLNFAWRCFLDTAPFLVVAAPSPWNSTIRSFVPISKVETLTSFTWTSYPVLNGIFATFTAFSLISAGIAPFSSSTFPHSPFFSVSQPRKCNACISHTLSDVMISIFCRTFVLRLYDLSPSGSRLCRIIIIISSSFFNILPTSLLFFKLHLTPSRHSSRSCLSWTILKTSRTRSFCHPPPLAAYHMILV